MRALESSENKDQILKKQCLAFFGTITASLSHELNNAMAIINEHNGLLDDMLLGFRQGVPLDDKKLTRISQKITAQVDRGREIIRRLNKFAHSTDSPVTEIEVSELLQAIINLAQRLAGLKGLVIEFKTNAEPLNLSTNPFFLQQAVFIGFELFMANPDANRLIAVSAAASDGEIAIKITGTAVSEGESLKAGTDLLAILMEQLNGQYEIVTESDGKRTIVLTLKGLRSL